MSSYLQISLKNTIRKFAYKAYAYYERKLKNKLSVVDFQTISVIKTMPEDAVCVDVGVNEGQLFNFMVKHCHAGTIYGFEPIPTLFNYLKRRYSSAKNVQLFQTVLSDSEQQVKFFYFPGRTGVSGLSRRGSQFGELQAEEINVTSRLMDEVLNLPRIDLIKIDVEGAEMHVLKGAKQHIIRCKPVIVFECGYGGIDHFKGTPEDVIDFFEELGYSISLMKYYLEGHPPFDRHTFIHVFKSEYEAQFIAYPSPQK